MSQQLAAPGRVISQQPIETDIPARLDRLPWSGFHWLLIIALGVTWVLDGLEVTIVSAISPVLTKTTTLGLTGSEMGLSVTLYLAGAITGALVFGHLTDRLGRKKLFTVTLLIYLSSALLTAISWNLWSFLLFRCMTGMAIGGEYAAINSAIDELIPARVRGRVDLAINGSYWLGAILGAAASVVLLDQRYFPEWVGWRISFGLGGVLGFAMIIARQFVPESPRWLLTHGRHEEAEEIMREIESSAGAPSREGAFASGSAPMNPWQLPRSSRAGDQEAITQPDNRSLGISETAPRRHEEKAEADVEEVPATGQPQTVPGRITIYPGHHIGFRTIIRTLLVRYRSRAILGLVLIASQAFFYNGISFTYPLVLNRDFGVAVDRTGLYVLCMALANFLGPLVLGPLFDTIGRRKMIAATYALSGAVIVGTELLFLRGYLNAQTQTLLWVFTFFFASAAASAGYLTVSEIFPLEMRALAIALFYAVGTAIGGLVAPSLFGLLIDTGRKDMLVLGYLVGAGLMILAAVVEWLMGVDTERKSLEDVAAPLSSEQPA